MTMIMYQLDHMILLSQQTLRQTTHHLRTLVLAKSVSAVVLKS